MKKYLMLIFLVLIQYLSFSFLSYSKEKEYTLSKIPWEKEVQVSEGALLKVSHSKNDLFPKDWVRNVAVVVDVSFNFSSNKVLNYVILDTTYPDIKFYFLNGKNKLAPVGYIENFPSKLPAQFSDNNKLFFLKEVNNRFVSKPFQGVGTLTLIFDLPKDAPKNLPFYFQVSVENKNYTFEVQ